MDEYGKNFKLLTKEEKDSVCTAAIATTQWTIYLEPIMHIRRTKCEKTCDPEISDIEPTDICYWCADLLSFQQFQAAMNRPATEEDKLKYVNKTNRNKMEAVLYGRYIGMKEMIEAAVRHIALKVLN